MKISRLLRFCVIPVAVLASPRSWARPNCTPDSTAPICNPVPSMLELALDNAVVDQGGSVQLAVREVTTGKARKRKVMIHATTDVPRATISGPQTIVDQGTLALRTSASTKPGTYHVTVDGGGMTVTAQIDVLPALQINVGGPWPSAPETTPIDLSACGRIAVHTMLHLAANVSGPTTLSIEGLPPGITASFQPPTFTATPGHDTVPVIMTLQSATGVAVASLPMAILVKAPQATGRKPFTVRTSAGRIDSVTPPVVSTPRGLQPGTTVVIKGAGFCPGSTVQFGNALAVVPATIDPSATSLTAAVPTNATGRTHTGESTDTGQVIVKSGGAEIAGPALTVNSWRNTNGFVFGNNPGFTALVGGYTDDDLNQVFGAGNLAVDWVLDPFTTTALMLLAERIYVGKGQCFGFSLAALNLPFVPLLRAGSPAWDGIDQSHSVPGIGRDAWHLLPPLTQTCQGSFGPSCKDRSPSLTTYIHQLHLHQFSSQMADFLASNDGLFNTGDFKLLARRALSDTFGALVILRDGFFGHVVPLIAVHDDGNGALVLETGNPNVPFGADEDAGDGVKHEQRLEASRVRIDAHGNWTYQHSDGKTHHSNQFDLFIAPASLFNNVDFPTAATALTAFAHLIFGSDGAHVRQISDQSGRTMLASDGKMNHDPTTRILHAGPWPVFGDVPAGTPIPELFVLPSGASYTYDLDSVGPYTLRAATPLYTAVADLGPAAAGSDRITLSDAGVLEVRTASAQRTFKAQLAVRNRDDKTHRGITVEGLVTRTGPARLEFTPDHSQVIYRHSGAATTLKLELSSTTRTSSTSRATRGRHVVPPIAVQDGDVVTVRPDWSALDHGTGSLQLRKAAGAVVVRPLQ